MTVQMRPRVKYVIGPDGSPLTIADLPPKTTRRWVIRRKAEVVAAVRGGLLSLGHPLSASGVRVVCDIVQQLRGEAGPRQKEGARIGLAQMLGGNVNGLEMGAASVHILAH